MNNIIFKDYFKDAEYDTICKYARFLPESSEPYILKRSTKMYNVILLNGRDYTNASIVLGWFVYSEVDDTHRKNFNTLAQQSLIQEFLQKYGCERFKGKSGELF